VTVENPCSSAQRDISRLSAYMPASVTVANGARRMSNRIADVAIGRRRYSAAKR